MVDVDDVVHNIRRCTERHSGGQARVRRRCRRHCIGALQHAAQRWLPSRSCLGDQTAPCPLTLLPSRCFCAAGKMWRRGWAAQHPPSQTACRLPSSCCSLSSTEPCHLSCSQTFSSSTVHVRLRVQCAGTGLHAVHWGSHALPSPRAFPSPRKPAVVPCLQALLWRGSCGWRSTSS